MFYCEQESGSKDAYGLRRPVDREAHVAAVSNGVQVRDELVFFERKPWIRATRAWRKRSMQNVETR
jgi:hypothetical protein